MSNKTKEKVVHRVSMTKAEKLGLAMSKIRGLKSPRAVAKLSLAGEQNAYEWQKDGYKGAWWQHYFSRNEKD